MTKYYVDSLKIEEFVNECNNCINEIKEQEKIMNSLISKTIWRGNAYDAALSKYNRIMKDINKIPQNLDLYVRFMEFVIKNYGEGTEKLKNDFQEIIEKLKLERLKNEL